LPRGFLSTWYYADAFVFKKNLSSASPRTLLMPSFSGPSRFYRVKSLSLRLISCAAFQSTRRKKALARGRFLAMLECLSSKIAGGKNF